MQESESWSYKYRVSDESVKRVIEVGKVLTPYFASMRQLLDRVQEGDRVLEIGCGTGQYIAFLAMKKNIEAHAVDYSEKATAFTSALAKKLGVVVNVQRADIQSLPYPDGFFSVVFGDQVIGHVEDMDKAMAELVRVMKPGGLVLLTFANRVRLDGWPLFAWLKGGMPYRQRSLSPWAVRSLVRRHGVDLVGSYGEIPFLARSFSLLRERLGLSIASRKSNSSDQETGQVPKPPSRKYLRLERLLPRWFCVNYGVVGKKRLFDADVANM